MYYRNFLKFLLFLSFLLPYRVYPAVPDSLQSALTRLKDAPLREFQHEFIQQLKDTNITISTKENLVKELLKLAYANANSSQAIQAAYTAGLINQYILDNGAMALYAYELVFKQAKEIDDREQMAAALWQSMSTLADLQLYDEALQYLFKVEAILQEHNYIGFESIAQKMLEMGSLFFNTGNYDVAIQYYEKAFSFNDLKKDKHALMYACNTLGLAYQMVGQYDQAVQRFEQSHKLGHELGERFWAALAYGNTGAVYFEQGRYEDALGHLLYDIEVSQELGVWNSAANACILVARIYRKQNKLGLAKSYIDLANSLDNKQSVWKTRNGIYEQYARLYTELGDYRKALEYHQAFKALSDTMNNDRLQKEQIMQLRKHRFELQKQELIGRKEQAALEQNVKESTQVTAILALVILILISALLIQFKRGKNQRDKLIESNLLLIQKKELALLRKEIEQNLACLRKLQQQAIPTQDFLPNTAFWEDFRHKFDDVHNHFFSKTKSNHPDLNQQDILWLALLKLKCSEPEIEQLFGVSLAEWSEHICRKLGGQQGVKLIQLVERL